MKRFRFATLTLLLLSLVFSTRAAENINLLVDCSHTYSFDLSDASRTQSQIFPGINCLTSTTTIHKLDLEPINALVILVDGKLPYHPDDAAYLLEYVRQGGGLYIALNTGKEYEESILEFQAGLGLNVEPAEAQEHINSLVAADHPAAVESLSWEFKRQVPSFSPEEKEVWTPVYVSETGEPVIIARSFGKGRIIADSSGVYHRTIGLNESAVTVTRKLIEWMSANKKVEPIPSGGGWQFSDGYRWDLTETTEDGLRIHFNEYTRMYVPQSVKAYHKTVDYLVMLTGIDEKQKATQITNLRKRKEPTYAGTSIDIDITGVQEITLETLDGGDGGNSDHSVYADAWFVDAEGNRTQVLLENASLVQPGFGKPWQDRLPSGRRLSIGGEAFETGIWLHANGKMVFPINGNYTRFISRVGCNDEGTGSVGFRVSGDGEVLWDDGKVYHGGKPGGNTDNVNYVPDGVLFQLKYLACIGAGFLLPQGAAVDVPPALKDDWEVHLGMLSHEMGHAWSYPFGEVMGEEGSAFIYNNLVLHHHNGQRHEDYVTQRLMNYLGRLEMADVDLAKRGHNAKYYIFMDLMIRQYGEEVFKNYNLLKHAILNKEGAKWDVHSTAWLWSAAVGEDAFPFFQTAFGSSVDPSKVQLPDEVMKAGFDPVAIGRLYDIPLQVLPRKRDIFSNLNTFQDVRDFYERENKEKGPPPVEG
jgi:hypothetical protein